MTKGWHNESERHSKARKGIRTSSNSRKKFVSRGMEGKGLINDDGFKILYSMLERSEREGIEYFVPISFIDGSYVIQDNFMRGDKVSSYIELDGNGFIHTHPNQLTTTFSRRDVESLFDLPFIGVLHFALGEQKWDKGRKELYREKIPVLKILKNSVFEEYEDYGDIIDGFPKWHELFPHEYIEKKLVGHIDNIILPNVEDIRVYGVY